MKNVQIDVKEIIRSKSPFLAKISWFVRWFKKLSHEEEINDFLANHGHLQGIEFANAGLKYLNIKVVIKFIRPLIQGRRYVFASNHPQGGIDGMALIKAIGDHFPELKFPVNDALMVIKNLESIFLPVYKDKKQNRDNLKVIDAAYASKDQQVLIFPAGLASRKIRGKVVDLHWHKHFVMKAIKYKRDVIPVYIDGENSDRFYQIANWRKRLRIPINIERLFLPDEMFRQKNGTITIVIGEPILHYELQCKPLKERADFVKAKVYELEKIHKAI